MTKTRQCRIDIRTMPKGPGHEASRPHRRHARVAPCTEEAWNPCKPSRGT